MQAGEKQSGTNQLQMDASYLLHHKTSWLREGDIAYLLSTSQNEEIKIEELDDEPDEGSILRSDKNAALIKNENPAYVEPSKARKGFISHESGKFLAHKSRLNTHMLTQSGEKRYSCDLCSKEFKQKQTFNYHMVVHSGVKAFSCIRLR